MTELSVSTCFDYDVPIDQQIVLIAEAGFTHVSPSRADHAGYLDKSRRHDLAARLADHGLGVDTIHGQDLTAPDAVETLGATAAAAAELGARTVVVHPTGFAVESGDVEDVVRAARPRLAAAIQRCRDVGVMLALENLLPGGATTALSRLLDDSDPQSVGLCYDSSHDQIDGPRPLHLLNEYRARVVAVHLSDRVAPFVDHLVPGEGFIDFDGVCAALASSSFDGPLLFEFMVNDCQEKRPAQLLGKTHAAGTRLADRLVAYRSAGSELG